MLQAGTFSLFGQKLINIIIHKQDVARITPIKKGKGCVIHLKNKVPYAVNESEREVYKQLDWVAA